MASHCPVHALSQPGTSIKHAFTCEHEHNEGCDSCQTIEQLLADIDKWLHNNRNKDERERQLWRLRNIGDAMREWRAHLLRSHQQRKGKSALVDALGEHNGKWRFVSIIVIHFSMNCEYFN